MRDNRRWTFSLEEAILWIMDSYFSQKWWFEVKNIFVMDLFLTNTHLFTLQDVNWWTGVLWIIVMFLSAVWTLILTAPIHRRGSMGEQVMQYYISQNLMKKQTHLHIGWPESEDILSKFSFLGELFLFISWSHWVTWPSVWTLTCSHIFLKEELFCIYKIVNVLHYLSQFTC